MGDSIKTLVIHPTDITTHFLDAVYKNEDWTVITDPKTSNSNIRGAIHDHDRIICMGHGTPQGLISTTSHYNYRYMVGSGMVDLLREKDLVLIWCNADQFGRKYGLTGFITGMIISEEIEANMYNVNTVDGDIDESNRLFTDAITKTIKGTPEMIKEGGLEIYKGDSDVIAFNRENFNVF